jgi:hypothetical protein
MLIIPLISFFVSKSYMSAVEVAAQLMKISPVKLTIAIHFECFSDVPFQILNRNGTAQLIGCT